MHYGDKEQVEENIIKIVVYQHEIWDDFKPTGKGDKLEIMSIQSCQYIRPWLVQRLLQYPDQYLTLGEISFDTWYLVTLKQIDDYNLKTISIEDVTGHENDFYKLH